MTHQKTDSPPRPQRPPQQNPSQKCGFVSVIGAPNAGKSTLVNALVGQKVAIVSPRKQTTRSRLMGVAIRGDVQMILLDTPGIFTPKRNLDRAMVTSAWGSIDHVDVIALLVDAAGLVAAHKAQTPKPHGAQKQKLQGGQGGQGGQRPTLVSAWHRAIAAIAPILAKLDQQHAKPILLLNKVDRVTKTQLLPMVEALHGQLAFAETFFISAHSGDGLDGLADYLYAHMPADDWHFPPDMISNISERMLAAEVTREQIFHQLHAELPYQSTVTTTQYQERRDGSLEIRQNIYVLREGHRAILIGQKGQRIREIGSRSRAELAQMLGRTVHLFLQVKHHPNWDEDRALYAEMGLEPV